MRIKKVSHFFSQLQNAPVQRLQSELLYSKNIRLDIKRDDLLHPIVSGNKWRKLKHVLLHAEKTGFKKLAVMGGHYSNLVHSLAYLCMLLGWELQLFIRGHKSQPQTPTLHDAVKWGAKLNHVERKVFQQLRETPPSLEHDVFWIGEGGYDRLALKGSVESLMELKDEYDYIVIACATGTSLAGYCAGVDKLGLKTKILGICVLNNNDEIERHVSLLAPESVIPLVNKDYTFGGYAKKNDQLTDFIKDFEQKYQIPLEPVYNGKSFFAVLDLVKQDYFAQGSKILLIHCGGLQGKRQ